jgi:hypothetical protein
MGRAAASRTGAGRAAADSLVSFAAGGSPQLELTHQRGALSLSPTFQRGFSPHTAAVVYADTRCVACIADKADIAHNGEV